MILTRDAVATLPLLAPPRPAGARAAVARPTRVLFLLFAAYLACPVLEVPLVGLSLSAPLFYLIAVRVYVAEPGIAVGRHRGWILFAYLFWMALLGSLLWNMLTDPAFTAGAGDLKALLRYAYWLLVFVTTAHLVSRVEQPQRIVLALAVGIVALGGLRLLEVALFGNWGPWTGTRFLAQNEYGFQFSIFAPYALALPLLVRGRARWPAMLGLLALWTAAVGNGSRSSWITVGGGILLFAALYAVSQRAGALRLWRPLAALVLLAGVIPFLPARVLEPIAQRYESFERLDRDKSYQIRVLMIQKSLRLFEQSPVFGAGLGRFDRTSVDLDRPVVLNRSEQSYNRRSAHNSYAALLAETGLAGVLPFAVLLMVLAGAGLAAAVRLAAQGEAWALSIYVSLLTMSVHLWTISALTNTTAWFTYGMVAGLIVRARRPRSATPPTPTP